MKRGIFYLLLAILISMVNNCSVFAGGSKDVSLEKIIVTQRGYYLDPIYYPLAMPGSEESTTYVVGSDEIIASHKETAVDAVTNVPGVVIERKGRKYPASIMIRGEKNLTVLVNGAYPGQDYRILNTLPSTLVDEIEVIRDSSYLAYGSPNTSSACGTPSFGGVVNIKLKKPEREHGTEVKTEYGSFNSTRESVTNAGKFKGLNYLFNLERYSTDGPKDENANQRNTGFTALLSKQYGKYSSSANLLLHYDEGNFSMQKVLGFSKVAGQLYEYSPYLNAIINFDLLHAWNPDISTDVNLYHNYDQATFVRNYPAANDMHNREEMSGFNLRQTFSIPKLNTLRLGAQFDNWNCPTGKLFYEGYPRAEQDYGGYLHDELRLLDDKLTLDGGLRWDKKHVSKGIHAQETVSSSTIPTYKNKWLPSVFNKAFGATVWPFKKHGINLRYSTSDQSNSLYADRKGNLLAGAEETRYDVGYIGKWSKFANVTFTLFRKKLSGTPVYKGSYTSGGLQVPYYYPSFIRRYGFESEVKGDIYDWLSYYINYTFIHSKDYTLEIKERGIPQYIGNFGLTYHHRGWTFNSTLQYVSYYKDNFLVTGDKYVTVGGYCQEDLKGSYEFNLKGFTHQIYLGVRNVGNVRYQTIPGWRDFGREIYGGYDLKF